MGKPKKIANPCFAPCNEIYKQWFEANYPYPPQFGPRAGRAMNEILDKLSGAYKISKGELPTVEQLNGSFKLVLDQKPNWGFWKDKCFHLWSINDKLFEILEEIKKNNGKQSESFANEAYQHIKDR